MKKTFQRSFTIVVSLVLMLSAVIGFASAEESAVSGAWGDSITWTLNEQGVLTVTGSGSMPYSCCPEDIPWNQYRSSVRSAVIGSGITSIAYRAFSDCTHLAGISLPSGITEIGDYAFSNCKVMEHITLPGSVETIGFCCFENCKKLGNIIIPSALKRIPDFAFQNCTSLRTVSGCGGLEDIGSHAFSGCTQLSSLSVCNGLLWISSCAFENCSSLYTLTLPSTLYTVDKYAFRNSGIREIVIPGSIGSLGTEVFTNCTRLRTVTISDGNIRLGKGLFSGCESLRFVTLPASLSTIPENLFSGCSSLLQITIPGQVDTIGDTAFFACSSLQEIDIPSSVTLIGYGSFYGCESMERVSLRDGLEMIDCYAFGECFSLESVTIPSTVLAVCDGAFYDCHALRDVVIESEDTEFGDDVFFGCGGTLDASWAHSCSFSDSLSLVYYIALPNASDYDNIRLEIEQDKYAGQTRSTVSAVLTDYTTVVLNGTDYLRFSYDGISAPMLGCECRAVLKAEKDGGHFCSGQDCYSIANYAYNMLGNSDVLLRSLCVDLLNYGSSAQQYFNVDPLHPVNAALTPAQLSLGSNAILQSCASSVPIANPEAAIPGKTCFFGNTVTLKYYITLPENCDLNSISAEITYNSPIGGEINVSIPGSDFGYDRTYAMYTIMLDGITSVDLSAQIGCKICRNGTQISDLVYYSVETYCYNMIRKNTDPALSALCQTLMNYNRSACAYFTAASGNSTVDLLTGIARTETALSFR